MKRYAIVRVDNRCPVEEEEDICLVDRIKMFPCFNDKRLSCKKCNYGDTKEQLVRKVQQPLFKRFMATNSKFKGLKKKTIAKRLAHKMALEIVKFLGVE